MRERNSRVFQHVILIKKVLFLFLFLFLRRYIVNIPSSQTEPHPPIVGIDFEYEAIPDKPLEVLKLSCQYCMLYDGKELSGIIYLTANGITFKSFINKVIQASIKAKVLIKYPETLIVSAHFLRADLLHFEHAFDDFRDQLRAIRRTVVSSAVSHDVELTVADKKRKRVSDAELLKKAEKDLSGMVNLYDYSRNVHKVSVQFYDTMLLAPAGQSLADIGELVGIPKVKIPPPYTIEKMSEFLKGEPKLFDEYAITDAIITAKYFSIFRLFCFKEGIKTIPHTVSSVALKLFKFYIKDSL